MNPDFIISMAARSTRRILVGSRVAGIALLSLIFAGESRGLITFEFRGSIVDRGGSTPITYNYTSGIQSQVNNVGNVLAFSGTVPASGGPGWGDPQGVPLQGDGRYADPARSTGNFTLSTSFSSSPGHLVTLTLAAVHLSNSVADAVTPGPDQAGIPSNTGTSAAEKLSKRLQDFLASMGGPVQLATGAEAATRPLFSFSGARNWGFELTYNSVLATAQNIPGPMGFGWTHPFEAKVIVTGANLVLQWNLTRSNTFTPKPGDSSTFVSTEDATHYDFLTVQAGGGWLLTRRDQSSLLFNSSGRLVEDRDPHGRKLLLAYDGSDRLSTVSDPISNTRLTFTYIFGGIRLETITDGTGAVVVFSYNPSSQMLAKIVNQNGKQATLVYDANRALLTLADHNGAILTSNTYDSLGRVTAQDDGVTGNQQLGFAYAEQGMAGNNLYAASDTGKVVPLPLPIPQSYSLTSFTRLDGQTINYNYNAGGMLASAVVNGQTTTVNYDAQGNAVSITDPSNQTSPVTQAILVTTTDRNGQHSTFNFDGNYNLRSLKNALNETTSYTYDTLNNLTSATDGLNRTTGYAYDAAGNVLTVTDPAGKVTTFTYDARNNLLTATDPLGHVTTRTYDARNNLLTVTDALGRTTTWTYDANSLPLTMTLPRAGAYTYAYTSGRLSQATDPNGVITKFGYDADGRLLYREDALGKRTTTTYDPIGNVLTVKNALNQTTTYTYDHRNRVHSVTEPTGAVTTFAYDNNNNLLTTTDALGKVTTLTYDGEDRLKTIKDALNRTTTNVYNVAGRLVSVTDPAGNVTAFEYDAAGQRTAVVDALGKRTTSAYDVRGLLSGVTDPLSRTATFAYDDLGRRITARDPLNRATSYVYDGLNRLQQVTDPGSLTASQGYDNDGNRSSLTNPASAATAFAYDAGDRTTGVTTAGGRVTGQSYDSRGLPLTTTEPSSQTTTLAYDDAARVSGTTDAVGTITYGRDANGRVLTVVEGSKTLTRVYDTLGRLTSYTDGDGNVMGYQYDDIGRLTKLTYPDTKQVQYAYDTAGRLQTVTDWASRVTTYSYDAVGRVTQQLRPNGTKQTRAYDDAGQLTLLKEYAPDGTTLIYSGAHAYDAAGQLIGETITPAPNPAPVTLLQTFDVDNRLLTHNGAATTFDADGNLLTIASGVAPASYAYDARNRLTSAGALTYAYDAENHRTAVTSGSGTTRYAINPNATLDQVLVRTAPDGTKTFYVYGLGLLHEQTGSTLRYYHQDRRGDTIAMTDSSGAVTDRASYGIYGELATRTGSTDTPFLFNGKWGVQTDGNGLYYHRARYYHPTLRRFLNEDTVLGSISTSASLNRFAYANGNPVTAIDPFGLMAQDAAPNSGPITYNGSISYKYGGVIFSYGTFTGEVTSNTNPAQTYRVTGTLNGLGLQLGYFKGEAPISFTATPGGEQPALAAGATTGLFTGSFGAGLGPVNFGSVDLTTGINNASGSLSPSKPEFGGLLSLFGSGSSSPGSTVSTDTNIFKPGDITKLKVGLGGSLSFQGITFKTVVLVKSEDAEGHRP